MKISRVKIYCQIKYFIFSIFLKLEKSKIAIKSKLSQQTNKKYVEFFGMCRTCFLVILEYLIKYKPKKNEILICSYNLEEMIDIARIYKFKVKLIDINMDKGSMDLKSLYENISDSTAAVLFTNMFNNHDDIRELQKVCKENDILLIEDNAIYFGNYLKENENKIFSGSFGDVSIFSFGLMKNVSAIFGGALVTSNKDLFNFAVEKNKNFQTFPLILYFKKFMLFVILKVLLSKYIYNIFFFYVVKLAHDFKIRSILKLIYPSFSFKPKKNIPTDYKSKISNTSLKIIYQIMNNSNFEIDWQKRKFNNELYYNLLSKNPNIKQVKIVDFNYQNFLDYPIIVKKNKDNLVKFLFKKGLEIRYHFYANFEKYMSFTNTPISTSKYYEDNLICLPSHPDIDTKKVERYCEEINNFYLNEQN
tara:strand:- start:1525 stop:2778 length:1254 start_codon:yes stop_codon:yes gene_type:complete